MIRMSKLADYSFVILNQMVSDEPTPFAASALAQKTTLPLPTVAKLMKLLAKAEIVRAQRGAAGGYVLALEPKKISVASVIEAVDGTISLTECVGSCSPNCATKMNCGMQPGWARANIAVKKALSSVSLADLSIAQD